MTETRPRIGIQTSPDILAMIFQAGASILTRNGYRINLAEDGVPADYRLQEHRIDPETRQLIFIFGPPGPKLKGPVKWQVPVYQREEGDGINP